MYVCACGVSHSNCMCVCVCECALVCMRSVCACGMCVHMCVKHVYSYTCMSVMSFCHCIDKLMPSWCPSLSSATAGAHNFTHKQTQLVLIYF